MILSFLHLFITIFDKYFYIFYIKLWEENQYRNHLFLDSCDILGYYKGQKRWRSKDGRRLYTWDTFHGEIEVFNIRGKYLGVLDPQGNFIKEAVKGRKIDV